MIARTFRLPIIIALLLAACAPTNPSQPSLSVTSPTEEVAHKSARPHHAPGELVDYTAQSGDTLPALAARFNTTVDEIRAANPSIPPDATTMPPSMPMKLPIYDLPLWAASNPILPDHAFVNSPTAIGFSSAAFVASHEGWLKNYREYAGGNWRDGAGIIEYVSTNFSVNPRLLLALLEYQSGALSDPIQPETSYILGYRDPRHDSVYLQLVWAANILNNGYYGWRIGALTRFEVSDSRAFFPDPWENAATVGIQYFFSIVSSGDDFDAAIGPGGFSRVYADLFGDPWLDDFVLIPGSLRQPPMPLPFQRSQQWTYTGGPHTGWGTGLPYASLDLAPPAKTSGCFAADSESYVIAMGDGMIVRSETGAVALDLDGDGNERTGWVVFYLHLGTEGRAPLGLQVKQGDPVGWPSCEGGSSTGTHVHIARKYNGEWISAAGPLAFNLDGWVAQNGTEPYLGTLERGGLIVVACVCSNAASRIVR